MVWAVSTVSDPRSLLDQELKFVLRSATTSFLDFDLSLLLSFHDCLSREMLFEM